jgi:hypothetical protein
VISDKLGLKKHLLWIIAVLLFLRAVLPVRLCAAAENQYLAGRAERRVVYRLCLLGGIRGD